MFESLGYFIGTFKEIWKHFFRILFETIFFPIVFEGIQNIVMLSGDKQRVVDEVAKKLNIETAKGDLLPEDKVNEVELL